MFLRIASRLAQAALLAAIVPAAHAIAAEPGAFAEYSVSTAGLDLGKGAGRAVVDRRIRMAAWHVCAEVTGGQSMADDAARDCFRRALADGQAASRRLLATAQAGITLASKQP